MPLEVAELAIERPESGGLGEPELGDVMVPPLASLVVRAALEEDDGRSLEPVAVAQLSIDLGISVRHAQRIEQGAHSGDLLFGERTAGWR